MKPRTNDRYVGIELEYASHLSIGECKRLLTTKEFNSLRNKLDIGSDGSIESTSEYYDNTIEFRLLSKVSELRRNLMTFQRFINKVDVEANSSCGIHVHLDMRNYNELKAFKKLETSKHFLSLLCKKSRRYKNEHVDLSHGSISQLNKIDCLYMKTDDIVKKLGPRPALYISNGYGYYEQNPEFVAWIKKRDELFISAVDAGWEKYSAINPESYGNYQTIEVRLLHSTTDMAEVLNWVNLLGKVAYSRSANIPEEYIKELKQFKKFYKLDDRLNKYIKESVQKYA